MEDTPGRLIVAICLETNRARDQYQNGKYEKNAGLEAIAKADCSIPGTTLGPYSQISFFPVELPQDSREAFM
jgi:hypothetical protein